MNSSKVIHGPCDFILDDYTLDCLARPLISIVTEYFKNPDNQKKYEQWLEERKKNENLQAD